MGVGLHGALVRAGEIRAADTDRGDVEVVAPAGGLLARLEGTVAPPGTRRRAYACRDLTERTHHIGGALGAALCTHALREGWVERIAGTRALAITPRGYEVLADLGVVIPAAGPVTPRAAR